MTWMSISSKTTRSTPTFIRSFAALALKLKQERKISEKSIKRILFWLQTLPLKIVSPQLSRNTSLSACVFFGKQLKLLSFVPQSKGRAIERSQTQKPTSFIYLQTRIAKEPKRRKIRLETRKSFLLLPKHLSNRCLRSPDNCSRTNLRTRHSKTRNSGSLRKFRYGIDHRSKTQVIRFSYANNNYD